MKLAVLLSGRGSNFETIHRATSEGVIRAEITCVISNRPDAAGIEKARRFGLQTAVFDHRDYPSREAHESAVAAMIDGRGADYIVLAGYMRRLTGSFVARYQHRIVNIHPSLLPSFPGVDAQRQALEHGVKIAGCTVHLVEEVVDGGPILVQRAVPVHDDDTEETLSARILEQEHIAYVEALQLLAAGITVHGRRVVKA